MYIVNKKANISFFTINNFKNSETYTVVKINRFKLFLYMNSTKYCFKTK